METTKCVVIILAILTVHVAVTLSTPVDFLPTSGCKGTIGECMMTMSGEFEEEMAMESESTRRILATTKYISYGALQRNTVPCSRRGASYYNCRKGAEANPYTRGCSRITRCRN